jgi:hypothetical protein
MALLTDENAFCGGYTSTARQAVVQCDFGFLQLHLKTTLEFDIKVTVCKHGLINHHLINLRVTSTIINLDLGSMASFLFYFHRFDAFLQ